MTIAIHAEGLSKRYLISRQRARSTSLGEVLSGLLRGGRESNAGNANNASNASSASNASNRGHDEFWALRDVSFRIDAGDRVGIIGRNGAGKSTLLKILSRITEPTSGRVSIRGRVASLLEVGTGFHPELSGRENVYLNGAILGMRREEIRRKFDEIVAFAEVEQFLDLPVKRYSSGMYVRLAFAVAAHLEPEILIVDEVLAVGDAAFQKKCIAKMTTVAQGGATVLFVSHHIAAIHHLCSTAILLGQGTLGQYGPVDQVMHTYLEQSQQLAQTPLDQRTDRKGSGAMRFAGVTLQDADGAVIRAARCGRTVRLLLGFASDGRQPLQDVVITVTIENEFGVRVADLSNALSGSPFDDLPPDCRQIALDIPGLSLMPGTYRLGLQCTVAGIVADAIDQAVAMVVEPGDFFGTGRLPQPGSQSAVLLPHVFRLQ